MARGVGARDAVNPKLLPRTIAAALSLGALALSARAQSDQACAPEALAPVDAWLAAHPFVTGSTLPGSLVAAACKPWPSSPSRIVVAAAYRSGSEERKNIAIALVDTAAGRVRSAFKGVIDEDPFLRIGAESLRVDTAPHRLAAGIQAFGVDVSSSRSTLPPCADGTWTWRRTLFVAEGATVRPVLDVLSISSWKAVPDPSRCRSDADDMVGEPGTTATTLSVATHATHGLADLVVTDTVQPTQGPARRERYTLRYDGSKYRGKGASLDAWGTIEPETAPTRDGR